MKFSLLALTALVAGASATTHFKETFEDGNAWTKRWVESNWKKSEGTAGSFKLTAGEWYGDADADKGIQTADDARFYTISSKADAPFNNLDKPLVFQFSVKHPQRIDCGGGYLKLMPASLDQKKFNGDSEYAIMFGPDVCGTSTRRVHVIFNYKGKNHLIKKDIRCETDQLSHVYTLIVPGDGTYEVRIDNKKVESGNLLDDWDFLPSKMIKDPSAKKPSDWVDDAKIPDPTDQKPEGQDDVPAKIPDPDAQKPADWDDEADGDWQAPMIDNPEFKGEWKPRMIDNPDYKGPWVHPMIPNPDYTEDSSIAKYSDLQHVGLEIWQVKAGSIFDNIIVTDDVKEAEAFFDETYAKNIEAERQMFNDAEKKKQEEEEAQRKKVEEEKKKQETKEEDEEEEEEDDEEEEEKKKAEHDEL